MSKTKPKMLVYFSKIIKKWWLGRVSKPTRSQIPPKQCFIVFVSVEKWGNISKSHWRPSCWGLIGLNEGQDHKLYHYHTAIDVTWADLTFFFHLLLLGSASSYLTDIYLLEETTWLHDSGIHFQYMVASLCKVIITTKVILSLTNAGASVHVKARAGEAFTVVGAPGVNTSVLAASIMDLAFINIWEEGGKQKEWGKDMSAIWLNLIFMK